MDGNFSAHFFYDGFGESQAYAVPFDAARVLGAEERFLFFTLTPSHMWLKRPVYRGFRGEGKCEGKCFTLTLPSHLTLPAGSTLLAGDSMNGRQIQWTGRKKAALYRQYSYGILLVQLCWHCWYSYAEPLV